MARILKVLPHLSDEQLRLRAEDAADPDERMRWIAILQKNETTVTITAAPSPPTK